jgi:hypothetical protein
MVFMQLVLDLDHVLTFAKSLFTQAQVFLAFPALHPLLAQRLEPPAKTLGQAQP